MARLHRFIAPPRPVNGGDSTLRPTPSYASEIFPEATPIACGLKLSLLGRIALSQSHRRATEPGGPTVATRANQRRRDSRLHGRNFEGFVKTARRQAPEKYDYLYKPRELEEIARTAKAERVYLPMNNNRGDHPATNGMQAEGELLEDWQPPDRDALVEELEARRVKGRRRAA